MTNDAIRLTSKYGEVLIISKWNDEKTLEDIRNIIDSAARKVGEDISALEVNGNIVSVLDSENNWFVEMQVLLKCEEVLKDRLSTTASKIHQAETIEERLSLGMYMAYEELLEEIQHKLGRGILD